MYYIYSCIFILLSVFMFIRNSVADRQHNIIIRAIMSYQLDNKLKNPFEVNYSDMEDYFKTLFRFWDWGYKHILPPEKYEIVKPYIEGGAKRVTR